MKSLAKLPVVSQLSNKVIRILGCNPGIMTLQGTNTYLIGSGARRVLIDCGDEDTAPLYVKHLENVLKEQKATINHLIITHWHHDHMDGVLPVQKFLRTLNNAEEATIWKFPRSPTDSAEHYAFDWKFLSDGQCFHVDDVELRVLYTPGHTTDHACLVMDKGDVLFSGDCILGEGTTVFEDLQDYMLSLGKILEERPKVIYPGHGPVIEDPIERIQFYIEHRRKREAEILETLRQHGSEMSEMDIVRQVYKETPKHLWPAAASSVGHHLVKLLKEKKIKGQQGCWLAAD